MNFQCLWITKHQNKTTDKHDKETFLSICVCVSENTYVMCLEYDIVSLLPFSIANFMYFVRADL